MKQITVTFNAYCTIALLSILTIFEGLFSEYKSTDRLIDSLTFSPALKVIVFICLFVISALVTSFVFKEIWNRFVVSVFEKREITLNEAYAVSFLAALVFLS